MDIEIKDYLWEIILDWEIAERRNERLTTHFFYDKGVVNGAIKMLAILTGMSFREVRTAVLNEAHSVGRLMKVK